MTDLQNKTIDEMAVISKNIDAELRRTLVEWGHFMAKQGYSLSETLEEHDKLEAKLKV